ncbi:hypothetical protein SNE40_007823 [Patella caerulea]|uniref:Metalloendopeptidase n=1 Tax=Patella caerulea TaxID=87958 RepID=A0AAN8JYG3_PATCE
MTSKFHQKYTCITFVPLTNDTRSTYNLDHDGYVRFVNKGSCYADVGNKRHQQDCSCCDRYSCIHELGHVLGLFHSHRSNHAEGWIRINWKEIRPNYLYVYRIEPESNVVDYMYDMTSMMHYPTYMYRNSYRPTMSNLVRGLTTGTSRFYPLRDINWYHRCAARMCNWLNKICANDGFITTVNGECDCMCPLHLDPATSCNTFLKRRKEYKWPSGHYTLIAPHTGCPDGRFDEGSLTHWSDGRNWHKYTWSEPKGRRLHLKGAHTWKRHTYYFCTSKNYSPLGGEWPRGSYCILRKGGECPIGFKSGFIQFDNEIRSRRMSNSNHGELPDGEYGKDTLIQFCCRDDGLESQPIELPNDKPMILFQAKFLGGDSCQVVSGMSHLLEFFVFDNIDTGISQLNGSVPRSSIYRGREFLIYYCYYEPLDYNCGEVINLDEFITETIITSPNYPGNYSRNMECHWLIKAPANNRLLLTFEDFDIEAGTTVLKPCIDKLSLGLGHTGQTGVGMCGTWERGNYQSIFNTINIILWTSMTVQRRGFKARISLITPESMCYKLEDKGLTYRGKVNVTEMFVPCLPWAEVTHCPHHPFKHGDFDDGLEGNYCRNPGDGLKPWCYIEKDGCERQYCDVCLKGPVYDNLDNCEELVKQEDRFCLEDARAASNCAKTCQSHLPPLPPVTTESEARCLPPSDLNDSIIVGTIKSSYKVGDTITYKCRQLKREFNMACLKDSKCKQTMGELLQTCIHDGRCDSDEEKLTLRCLTDNKCDLIRDQEQISCLINGTCDKSRGICLKEKWCVSKAESIETCLDLRECHNETEAHLLSCLRGDACNYSTVESALEEPCLSYGKCYIPQALRQSCLVDGRCNHAKEVLTRSCLTDGSWTSGGFVCGACPDGWSIFREQCYKHFNKGMFWNDANQFCQQQGGLLTTAKDKLEAEFVTSIRIPLRTIWIGLTDLEKEGEFVWSDGTPATWTNFKKGAPNNGYKQEHCVALLGEEYNNEWEDNYCGHHYRHSFVCKIKPQERSVCADRLNNCQKLLLETPTMCTTQPAFAWAECSQTCGMCNKHKTRRCTMPLTPKNTRLYSRRRLLYRGRTVRYECEKGHGLTAGNLDRVCKADGRLSGSPPVCVATEKTTTYNNEVYIKDRGAYAGVSHVFTGTTKELLIPRRGRIIEWHFYVGNPGEIALQIYRPPANANSYRYTLISSLSLITTTRRYEIIKLPTVNQTLVEEGDLLGVWYGKKDAGVSFAGCNGNFYKEANAIRKAKFTNSNSFVPDKEVNFSNTTMCGIFSLKVLIGPI